MNAAEFEAAGVVFVRRGPRGEQWRVYAYGASAIKAELHCEIERRKSTLGRAYELSHKARNGECSACSDPMHTERVGLCDLCCIARAHIVEGSSR